MYRIAKMTYQDGVLKSPEALPLEERQQVLVLLLPLPTKARPPQMADPQRMAVLREKAAAWLSQQPADALRPPLALTEMQARGLDEGFDTALMEIRQRASQFDARQIAADVNQALAEVRALSAPEHARLQAELDAFLTDWAANAD
jgi:hypothetical protein